ncbi:SMP-30/gluconolactonase/LRE family protein [Vreelandella janggokensis]|uniref:SMP-30/gluconolactonase/LRE family protein n=1 Tax=Vreelandella janggokensis TaxID=370767 RepID=A0ABT4IXX5_9GAMM|nr:MULTISPECIES: SMP-30/gluconolactonase/LRE family protein [Halomonas]MCW4153121.1 SMP-30/gluconolactonase/LRE family protein [Halomonas sp. 18H]MCZ0928533.1 SMP-30/gluconolactonase/LRE family protein [Halomonas janggokensis]
MNHNKMAELAVDCRCELGEGPQWDAGSGRLYWCDILGKCLHWQSLENGEHGHYPLEQRVSLATPLNDGRLMLVGEHSLSLLNPATQRLEHFADFEADNPVTRSNDARVDRHGSLWLSTMGKTAEPEAGSLYRLHRGELTRLRSGLTIPNAICFSPMGDAAYFTDTATGIVMRWALDSQGWPVGEPVAWADFTALEGNPDGAVIDSEGCLWLALWGAGKVVRLDTAGQVIDEVHVPVSQPSCPAFAGPGLETLYITTAQEGFSDAQRREEPLAGGLFKANVGVHGLADPLLTLE